MNSKAKEMIYKKYIRPTERERSHYVGIEVELPIVNISGKATDHEVSKAVFSKASEHFRFTPEKYDVNGVCHEAVDQQTGDIFSFDCSYNNFEISFGKEISLVEIEKRFKKYITFLNSELGIYGHIITGMGIQPYYRACNKNYLPDDRYKMLEGYLAKSSSWKGNFHKYPEYGTFASASQVQLDADKSSLLETIGTFSLLEPFKAVLFANSVMSNDEPGLLCVRDMLWENSTHGINTHNIGMYEALPQDPEELTEYISYTSIFCAERDGKYFFFYPVPFAEYLKKGRIRGEYYKDGEYHSEYFEPLPEDIKNLRTYKFLDLTARGTIEYRSVCTQPLRETFAPAALQTGLAEKLSELGELIENDKALYHHGYTASELRKLMNRDKLPGFVDKDKLRSTLTEIVCLAEEGLIKRGYGEEVYLKPVMRRAETLTSPAREMKQKINKGIGIEQIIELYSTL